MNCSTITTSRHRTLEYTALFVIITFIMCQAPLISDDFIFANLNLSGIYDTICYVLHYGNGRVLGNLCAVVFVEHKVACALFKALVITTLTNCIHYIVFPTSIKNQSVVMLLILGTSTGIFGQVYTWTSGFMNYVPPVTLMLLCMCIVRSGKVFAGISTLLVFLGFTGQLFVEHSTIINLLLSLCMYLQHRNSLDLLGQSWHPYGFLAVF